MSGQRDGPGSSTRAAVDLPRHRHNDESERSTGSRRDPYKAVGAAMRAAMDAACHAEPPLRPREWRVLAAVVSITASWSRLEDEVSHGQLQVLTGIAERRTLARELRSLAQRGIVMYEPGDSTPGGGRTLSRVGLAPGRPIPPVDPDPRSLLTPGQDGHRPPVDPGTRPPVGTDPPPEYVPEEDLSPHARALMRAGASVTEAREIIEVIEADPEIRAPKGYLRTLQRNGDLAAMVTRHREQRPTPTPPWCGECDESSRLRDLGDGFVRCAECHPLAEVVA